jgi:hypothetical protein
MRLAEVRSASKSEMKACFGKAGFASNALIQHFPSRPKRPGLDRNSTSRKSLRWHGPNSRSAPSVRTKSQPPFSYRDSPGIPNRLVDFRAEFYQELTCSRATMALVFCSAHASPSPAMAYRIFKPKIFVARRNKTHLAKRRAISSQD